MAGVGLIAGVAGGLIYAYGVVYIPIIYLNFILTALFGALIGAAVGLGARAGKVRSAWYAGLSGRGAGSGGPWARGPRS